MRPVGACRYGTEMTQASNKIQSKRQPKGFSWVILFILLLGLACAAVLIHGLHFVNVQTVESAISQDLPSGSDEDSVRGFMDSHHILYTGYSQQFRRMYGKIYRSSIVGYMMGHILIEFNFDERGRMVSHSVVEVYDFVWE